MPVSREFLDFILDQLSDLSSVTYRMMFGGAGIYSDGTMFGLVADDTAYLKVDDTNRTDYEDRHLKPFKPWPNKAMVMPYYEIPPEVLEDPQEFVEWAERSLEIAKDGKQGDSLPGR